MSSKTWLRRVATLAIPIVTAGAVVAGAQNPPQQPQPQPKPPSASEPDRPGNAVTDGWITMKIHALFVPEKALENSDINVDTKAGAVTLNGTVPSNAARDRAVTIAKTTEGVKNVTDNLKVAPEATGTTGGAGAAISDGWLKSKIYAQFIDEDALEGSDINLDVSKGVVTLKGLVRSEAGRDRAVEIVKATEGVKTVNDQLVVESRPS
jgi:hyperosmotically inducible protein